jgi:hypothetical protein
MRRLLVLSLIAACTTVQGRPRSRLPDCAASGEEILCGGNTFAELVCINRVKRQPDLEVLPDPSRPAGPRACRALGIHYLDDDSMVWLYLAPGFDPERPDLPYREAKLDPRRAVSVMLSPDGSKVRYRTGSIHPLQGQPVYQGHEYDLFKGTLNDD